MSASWNIQHTIIIVAGYTLLPGAHAVGRTGIALVICLPIALFRVNCQLYDETKEECLMWKIIDSHCTHGKVFTGQAAVNNIIAYDD